MGRSKLGKENEWSCTSFTVVPVPLLSKSRRTRQEDQQNTLDSSPFTNCTCYLIKYRSIPAMNRIYYYSMNIEIEISNKKIPSKRRSNRQHKSKMIA